jgi:hypothetical protein
MLIFRRYTYATISQSEGKSLSRLKRFGFLVKKLSIQFIHVGAKWTSEITALKHCGSSYEVFSKIHLYSKITLLIFKSCLF